MEFCPRCGSIMVPRREGNQVVLVCPKCGYRKLGEGNKGLILTKKVTHKETEKTFVIDTEDLYRSLPKVRGVKCPKCGHDEAFYKIIQTRRADEPPTRIYKCTRCGHVWREYE